MDRSLSYSGTESVLLITVYPKDTHTTKLIVVNPEMIFKLIFVGLIWSGSKLELFEVSETLMSNTGG